MKNVYTQHGVITSIENGSTIFDLDREGLV